MENSEQPSGGSPEEKTGAPETGANPACQGQPPERKLTLAELQQRVAEEIGRFYDGNQGERVRNLCRLAVNWNVDPETYRRLLQRFGLRPARASEIKSVLMCEEECRKFLAGGPWKLALKNSRLQGDRDLRRNAARLLRLLWANQDRYLPNTPGDWAFARDGVGQMQFVHAHNGRFEVLNLIETAPFKP